MSVVKKIQTNVLLAPLTTFQIGGPAEYFVEIKNKSDLGEAINWAQNKNIDINILGGGSNVLIPDSGVSGLVIKLNNNNIQFKGERIELGAGASLIKSSHLSFSNSLSGLEWAIGIPGTVGGAIRGNAGAFGSYISDILETVEIYNKDKQKFFVLSKNDCEFAYKKSIFQKNKNLLIWQAVFKLKQGQKQEMEKLQERYLKHRDKTQPRLPSAGCIFKNINREDAIAFNKEIFQEYEKQINKEAKMLSVGWLIDRADLKGKVIGGAKISLEHGSFIVNTGRATFEDVLMLISYIKQQIRDRFNIQLFEEIEYFGV